MQLLEIGTMKGILKPIITATKKQTLLSKKGLSLAEVLIAVSVSIIILGGITSLYLTSNREFLRVKALADTKETTKQTIAGIEWIMERWGTSTPCNDPDGNNNCLVVRDCRLNGEYVYPPPSSLCITINNSSPCDELIFYGSLYGNGFVERIAAQDSVAMVSCRLSSSNQHNCYHIKRGGMFIRDIQNNNTALIFKISNLSASNVDCIEFEGSSNVTAHRRVTALNGAVAGPDNISTQFMNLEGGDMLLRVPHRIRIFCQANPNDNNRRWLYMEATDMASNCSSNEPAQPLAPVDNFEVEQVLNGIRITMTVRGDEGRTINIQRFFGR